MPETTTPTVPPTTAPTAPVSAPAPPSSTFDWGTVDPSLKGEKTLQKFTGKTERELLGHVGRAYTELEKRTGTMVTIPGADAKPEDLTAFHTKLGVPEKPEGYPSAIDLKLVPETMKDSWDATAESVFRKEAHDLGLTPRQYQGVLNAYVRNVQGGFDLISRLSAEEVQASQEKLSASWGGNYKRNLALAQRTTQSFDSADKEFTRLLETEIPGVGRLGNHPAYLAWAARVGHAMLEGNFIKGEDLTTTKGDAQKELDSLMSEIVKGRPKDVDTATWRKKIDRTLELRKITEGVI